MPCIEHLLAARQASLNPVRAENPRLVEKEARVRASKGQIHRTPKPGVAEGPMQPAVENVNSIPPVVLLRSGHLNN